MGAPATSPQHELLWARVDNAPAVREWLANGGWRVVSPRDGSMGDRGGLTAHRGVLTDDEWRWLNREAVVADVERRLGFTVDELRRAYCQGRPSAAKLALRARVDGRLLELRRSGANLSLLARVTDVHEKTLSRALARARAASP